MFIQLKTIAIAFILSFLLVSSSLAKEITFEWEQILITDFGGWKLYKADIVLDAEDNEVSVGPYVEFATLPFVSEHSTYTTTQTLAPPNGKVSKYYFVLTAYDNDGNESAYSDAVTAIIDLKSPDIPRNFRLTVPVQ